MDAHGVVPPACIAALQCCRAMAACCSVTSARWPGNRRAQLPHAIEMDLGQRDEFPDARIAADARDAREEGVILLQMTASRSSCRMTRMRAMIALSCAASGSVIWLAALRTLSTSSARRSTKPSSPRGKEIAADPGAGMRIDVDEILFGKALQRFAHRGAGDLVSGWRCPFPGWPRRVPAPASRKPGAETHISESTSQRAVRPVSGSEMQDI